MKLMLNDKLFGEKSLEIEKVNLIVGPNNAGKTGFCNYLENGFNGKLKKSFILSGNEVRNNDYQVILISENDNIEKEKSFTSKSEIKQRLSFTMDTIDNQIKFLIEEKMNELSLEINNLLNDVELSDGLTLTYSPELSSFFGKNLNIMYKHKPIEELASSLKRFVYYDLFLDKIEKLLHPTVLIIDDFDIGFSEGNRMIVINQLLARNLEHCWIFLSTVNYYEHNINKIYINNDIISNSLIEKNELYEELTKIYGCSINEIEKYLTKHEINDYLKKNDYKKRVELEFINSPLI